MGEEHAPAAARDLALELLVEAPAVEQPAQRVVVGEVAQLLLAPAPRVDVLDLRDPVERLAVGAVDERRREVRPRRLPREQSDPEFHPQHPHLPALQPLDPLAHELDVVAVRELLGASSTRRGPRASSPVRSTSASFASTMRPASSPRTATSAIPIGESSNERRKRSSASLIRSSATTRSVTSRAAA